MAKIDKQLKKMNLKEFRELYKCRKFKDGFSKITKTYGKNCLSQLSLKIHQLEDISTQLEKHMGAEFRDAVIATGSKLLEIYKIEFLGKFYLI